jgi:hypothetical protein
MKSRQQVDKRIKAIFNRIEQFFNKITHSGCVATHYKKGDLSLPDSAQFATFRYWFSLSFMI